MSIIFDSIKTRNLDQVYEINLNQYFQHMVNSKVEHAGVLDSDFSVQISTGIKHPEFNAVLQMDISDNFETVYENTNSFFTDKGLPYTWYAIPSTEPEGIQQSLEEKGLRYIGYDTVVGVELDNIIRNISQPNSLYIEAIDTYAKLEKWVDLYTKSRNIKGDSVDILKQIYEGVDFGDPKLPYRKYIGWLNGEPIACSTLVISGGISVVYDETLLPRYKNFGIQEAINITPLKKSRDMGFKVGLLPVSIANIKRFTSLGFKDLFNVKKFIKVEGRGGRSRRPRR